MALNLIEWGFHLPGSVFYYEVPGALQGWCFQTLVGVSQTSVITEKEDLPLIMRPRIWTRLTVNTVQLGCLGEGVINWVLKVRFSLSALYMLFSQGQMHFDEEQAQRNIEEAAKKRESSFTQKCWEINGLFSLENLN